MPAQHSNGPVRAPRYRQVAEEIRRRITAGAYPRGTLLPSEFALQQEFGVSRGTIQKALTLLQQEGLTLTESGRGTLVRTEQMLRRITSERYRHELARARSAEPAALVTDEHSGIAWADYGLDRNFSEVPAGPALALLMDVPPDAMLLSRRFVLLAHGLPQQMIHSYYPLDLVAGTPVADPLREPWPGGNIAQLHSLGVDVTAVRERVRVRMPTPEEARTLRLPAGVPVLAITRQTYAGASVVEAALDIAMPADRVELDYLIELRNNLG